MKGILKALLFYTTSLFLATLILEGLKVHGNIQAYIIGGISLTIMMFILKPILQLLSFPLNALTFGFFSFIVNAVILFVLTIFVPQVTVQPFSLPSLRFIGFVTPIIALNKWFAFLVASIVISGIYSLLTWVTTD